jgi:hypothetical protein
LFLSAPSLLHLLWQTLNRRIHHSAGVDCSAKFRNTKIDIKSTLLGLGLGVLATIAVAASTLPGPVGRFQIADTANHGLVLETATGQV